MRSRGQLLERGIKVSPLSIGVIVGGHRRSARHEAREPPRTGAYFRRLFAGGGQPAEPRGSERSTDPALLDAVNGNAEHVGDDLRPECRARSAAHEIDLRDRSIGAAQSREIVARGEGYSFEHRLDDIVASGRAAKAHEGAGCSAIMWRRAVP